ncbi:MAG: orotidine-5'-phosphate decarboxylase [Parcubacteria group bacterium]
MERTFIEMIKERWRRGFYICVGLDSDYEKLPSCVKHNGRVRVQDGPGIQPAIFNFNYEIVKATNDLVCAYKVNTAPYEAWGTEGIGALNTTLANIRLLAPDVPVILDAKRADIGNTNKRYAQFAFSWLQANAITTNPYFGEEEGLDVFLQQADKGIFVLCRTSNKGAKEVQDLQVRVADYETATRLNIDLCTFFQCKLGKDDTPTISLWEYVAHLAAYAWNKNGNCCIVVGATYPQELCMARKIVGEDMPILIPGIGAQGGDLRKVVEFGMNYSLDKGIIINASRSIIFASDGPDFARAARSETGRLHNLIHQYRQEIEKERNEHE